MTSRTEAITTDVNEKLYPYLRDAISSIDDKPSFQEISEFVFDRIHSFLEKQCPNSRIDFSILKVRPLNYKIWVKAFELVNLFKNRIIFQSVYEQIYKISTKNKDAFNDIVFQVYRPPNPPQLIITSEAEHMLQKYADILRSRESDPDLFLKNSRDFKHLCEPSLDDSSRQKMIEPIPQLAVRVSVSVRPADDNACCILF